MTLYEMNQSWQEVFELLLDPDVPEEAVYDSIEGIEAGMEEKADSYAKILKSMEGDTAQIDAEIKRLQERKQAINRRHDWMKQSLFDMMKATGRTKFKTALFSFGIQRNGGKNPIDLTGTVPAQWLKPGDPDIGKIREYLENGGQLPFAVIGEPGESLRIR